MSLFNELQCLDANLLAETLQGVLDRGDEAEDMVVHNALTFPTYAALMERVQTIAERHFGPSKADAARAAVALFALTLAEYAQAKKLRQQSPGLFQ